MVVGVARVQTCDDQDNHQHHDGRDGCDGTTQSAWAVIDAVHRLVAAPGHERGRHRLGSGAVVVVELERFGRMGHRRWWRRGDKRVTRLGQSHGRGSRDAERVGGIGGLSDIPVIPAATVAALKRGRCVRPYLLERVQLAVVVLDGVRVVL